MLFLAIIALLFALPFSIASKIARVQKIYSIITGLGYGFLGRGFKGNLVQVVVKALYRLGLKYNNKVFFQNPDDLELFVRLKIVKKRDRAVLINGSGVDTNYFSIKPLTYPVSFLMISRLIGDKGVREYVEAAGIVKKKYPDVIFRLAGWIDVNPSAVSKDELDLWIESGVIDFLGRLDDVRPAIEKATVYVLPSYREGTPRTVLEAMSMGRPIITTDAPGCRETVIDGVNGLLVNIKDVDGLVSAMEKLICDPSMVDIMGMSSHKIALDKYDVDKVNQVILKSMELV